MPPALRGRLKALGVRAGPLRAVHAGAAEAARGGDAGAAVGAARTACRCPALPAPALVSLPPPADWPAGFAAAMGWVEAGPVLLRLDVAERVAGELGYRDAARPRAVPAGLASRLSVKAGAAAGGAARGWASGWCRPAAWRRRVRPAGAGDAGAAAPAAAGRPPQAAARRAAGARPVRRAGGAAAADGGARHGGPEDRDWQRLDKWLWCARFMRARADCAGWSAQGRLRINRQPTDKPHARLRVGDVLTLPVHGEVRVVRVLALAARRGPAQRGAAALSRDRRADADAAHVQRPLRRGGIVGISRALTFQPRPSSRGCRMTYVVTENCIRCKYMDCVEVCPVDCFYVGENMLVIHPDECIDCGVCEPECPAEAIVPDSDDQAAAWAGAEPHLCDALAEHHPQGRAAGRCRRLEGQAGQGKTVLAGARHPVTPSVAWPGAAPGCAGVRPLTCENPGTLPGGQGACAP